MDGSPLQDWDKVVCLIRGKHLSGVTGCCRRAPKWRIRTRAPLQLVGLPGLDNSQAPRASVRSVQSIFPSPRNRWVASGSGAIGVASPQHGPDNPRCFVSDSNLARLKPRRSRSSLTEWLCGSRLFGAVRTTALAPCTNRLRRCSLPRFEIPIVTRSSSLNAVEELAQARRRT